MTEITNEEYTAALQVVAAKEKQLLEGIIPVFTELKDTLTEYKDAVEILQNQLPPPQPGVPSNIRAIVEQYSGQIRSFVDQAGYMINTTAGLLNSYNPPESQPLMPGPVPTPVITG